MKSILIMAAGKGSRYGTLKQFDQLGPAGEFLFEYSIYDAISCGFDHVIVITKASHESQLRDYLRARLPEEVGLDVLVQQISDLPENVEFSGSRQKPWGTAHAVWTARNCIDSYFVVVNADDFYGSRSMELASEFIDGAHGKTEFGLVPYVLSETLSEEGSVSRAVCRAEAEYLKEIIEYKEVVRDERGLADAETGARFSGGEITSMNFWILTPLVFDLIEKDLRLFVQSEGAEGDDELFIPKQVQHWMSQGQVRVRLTEPGSDWFGVTYSNDKYKAVEKLNEKTRDNSYPSPLWKKLETS
jgi:NDP-sugar pyrophosphorylase family protein